jgi:RNA-directed DNA polymerase
MSAQRQQGTPDAEDLRAPVHPDANGPGGTGAVAHEAQQTLTAWEEQRALTVNLMEQVCEPNNLIRAYRRVRRNKGTPGVDGMSVQALADWLREHHATLTASLRDGSYRPKPVRGVEIPKPGGGKRQLGIPCVVDRLVQQMILQVVEPILDPTFSDSSFGFRPGRSAHQALEQARKYANSGREFVVDLDLEKFFDRVNHDILMSRLARRIGDKHLLRLVRRFLSAGMMQNGVCIDREEGTPQGGPLSPLLANLLLDDLDRELHSRGHYFCRYADDCNIYVQSQAAGERVMASVVRFLEEKLRLRVNREKSAVARVGERKFLGHKILLNGKLGVAPKSWQRAKERIREITRRNRGVSFAQVIREVTVFLNGWLLYYRYAMMRGDLIRTEEWLRRKLRCLRLRQCKRGRTVARLLRHLGVFPHQAARLASSGKGWWRMALSPQANQAMSADWFRSQGLIDLVARYDELHI